MQDTFVLVAGLSGVFLHLEIWYRAVGWGCYGAVQLSILVSQLGSG